MQYSTSKIDNHIYPKQWTLVLFDHQLNPNKIFIIIIIIKMTMNLILTINFHHQTFVLTTRILQTQVSQITKIISLLVMSLNLTYTTIIFIYYMKDTQIKFQRRIMNKMVICLVTNGVTKMKKIFLRLRQIS